MSNTIESLKKGDTLYLQDVPYGTPKLLQYSIGKVTPKQYVLTNGIRVRKEDLREIGAHNQYVIKPDEAFLASVRTEKARSLARDAVDNLRGKIVNRKLTKEQYESIVEFAKQFEDK